MKQGPRGKTPIFIALSLDIDPDANMAVGWSHDCVSRGFQARVRLLAVRRGLCALCDQLSSLGLPTTLFWEARTLEMLSFTAPSLVSALTENASIEHACHGWRHEDFTGALTDLHISEDEIASRIEKATSVIAGRLGIKPVGFRAPYCRINGPTLRVLAKFGYLYDSSMTVDPFPAGCEKQIRPALADEGEGSLWEIPILKWRDPKGKPISGYLWQLLEGRRRVGDYIRMVMEIADRYPGQLIQLIAHPWHLYMGENGRRNLDPQQSIAAIGKLLHTLSSHPRVRFVTLSNYLGDQDQLVQVPPAAL